MKGCLGCRSSISVGNSSAHCQQRPACDCRCAPVRPPPPQASRASASASRACLNARTSDCLAAICSRGGGGLNGWQRVAGLASDGGGRRHQLRPPPTPPPHPHPPTPPPPPHTHTHRSGNRLIPRTASCTPVPRRSARCQQRLSGWRPPYVGTARGRARTALVGVVAARARGGWLGVSGGGPGGHGSPPPPAGLTSRDTSLRCHASARSLPWPGESSATGGGVSVMRGTIGCVGHHHPPFSLGSHRHQCRRHGGFPSKPSPSPAPAQPGPDPSLAWF